MDETLQELIVVLGDKWPLLIEGVIRVAKLEIMLGTCLLLTAFTMIFLAHKRHKQDKEEVCTILALLAIFPLLFGVMFLSFGISELIAPENYLFKTIFSK